MKIVQVTPRYPPHTGGVEKHVKKISERLVKRGHDVTIFSADNGSEVPADSIDNGVQVQRFQSLSPDNAFYIAPQIARAIRYTDADIVHVHNYHALPLFFAALGVTDECFIVTTHYHGESASRYRDILLSFYRPFGKWAMRQADEIIAVSEWESKRLWEDYDIDATVIPNGVNVERFTKAEPEMQKRPYLLCVGRLEEYKGVQHVIQAVSKLPEYDLIVAGSGAYRNELERIAQQEDVSDRVEFLGYVDDDRLPELYAGAEVYVTMSEFEAYGMTVAEALAAETPCVIRKEGALRDWMTTEGVIGVAEPNIETIVEGVKEACNRALDHNPLTWNEYVDSLVELYKH